MKKTIGILGVAVLAVTMFMNANSINKSDIDLASLMKINSANAEGLLFGCQQTGNSWDECTWLLYTISNCEDAPVNAITYCGD